jgi:hypothetical protein
MEGVSDETDQENLQLIPKESCNQELSYEIRDATTGIEEEEEEEGSSPLNPHANRPFMNEDEFEV